MRDVRIKLLLDGQAQVISGIEGVNQKLAGIGRGAQVSAQASESLSGALARVGHYGIAGGALYGVAQSALSMGRALFEASASAQRLTTQLNFATGGRGAQELAFTADVAQRLGLEFKSVAQAYAGFASAARGTALEGAAAQQVFEGIAKASAVMGLSADQTSGALLAVQQMMSKGVVSAEEFRGQLGERMPIALQAGAQALGVTTAEFSKMLESGQIVAQDFLPKFSRAITEMLGDSVEQAANRLDASVARMGNAWERLKQTVGDSGVSKAVANEATGISQYLDSVSDAMKRAEKAGSGTLMQLSAGLGQIIARAPFDVLAGSASLLNGTINTLSGGAARLNTNINLLPDALKTTAQQALALESNLKTAKSELSALQRQAETQGQSIYLKSEMHQLALYIQKLEEAKNKQASLSGAGPGRGIVNPPTVGAMLEQQQRDADAANALRLKLSGVPDGYLKDMAEIIRLNQVGALVGKDYTDALKKQQETLLKKTGAAQGAAKAHRDTANAFESEQTAAKSWEKAMEDAQEALSRATAKTEHLSESERKLRDYMASSAAVIMGQKVPAANAQFEATMRAAIAQEKLNEAERGAVKAAEEATRYAAELNAEESRRITGLREAQKAVQDYIDSVDASAAALQFETGLMGLDAQARANAIAQYRIQIDLKKRLKEIDEDPRYTGDAEAVAAARETAKQKARDAAVREGATASAQAALDKWQSTADSIYNGLTDSLYRAFESGKGFFRTLWDGIKNTFRTTVLKLAVQGVMGGVTGALGLGSTAANAGGVASGFSGASGALSTIGMLTGNFGAGLGAGFSAGLGSLGGGWSLGTGMMGAGSTAGGLGAMLGDPLTMGIAALVSIISSLDDSGTYHTGGAGKYSAANGSAVIDATTLGTADVVSAAATEQAATTAAKTIASLLDSTALAFGKTAGYEAATAFADDSSKDGAWGALVINKLGEKIVDWQDTQTSQWAPKEFADGEAGQKQYTAALAASVRDAIDQIGLPAWAQTMLDSLGDSTTMESLASVMEAINATHTALSQMGDALTGFASLSDAAKSKLIAASGGVAALAANAATYYEAYYTEGEKAAVVTRQVTQALAAVGLALPATNAEFRALVEAQTALGAAGTRAHAALLGVSGAFATLQTTALASQSALRGSLTAIANSIKSMRDRATAADEGVLSARSNIREAYNAAQERTATAQSVLTALLEESEQATRAFGQTLTDYLLSLNGAGAGMDAGARYRLLGAELQSTATLAQGGDQASRDKLTGVAGAFLESARANSRTSLDYARDLARVRATLEGVQNSLPPVPDARTAADQIEEATKARDAAVQEQVRYAALAAATGTSLLESTDAVGDEIEKLRTAYEESIAEQNAAYLKLDVALAALQTLGLTESTLNMLAQGWDGSAAGQFAMALDVSAEDITRIKEAIGWTDAELDALAEALNVTVSDEVYQRLGMALGVPAEALGAIAATFGTTAVELSGLVGSLPEKLRFDATTQALATELNAGVRFDAATRAMVESLNAGVTVEAASAQMLAGLNAGLGLTPETAGAVAGLNAGLALTPETAGAVAGLNAGLGLTPETAGAVAGLNGGLGVAAGAVQMFSGLLKGIGFDDDTGLDVNLLNAGLRLQDGVIQSLSNALGLSAGAAGAISSLRDLLNTSVTQTAFGALVDSTYVKALNRTSDEAGRAYWLTQLYTGAVTQDNFLAEFLQGAKGEDVAIAKAYGKAQGLPGFAVGTSYVPYDMTAQIHAGEEITPRPYVDAQAADRAQTNTLLARLVASNAELLRSNADLKNEVALMRRATQNTDKTLTNVTRGGNAMLTEAA